VAERQIANSQSGWNRVRLLSPQSGESFYFNLFVISSERWSDLCDEASRTVYVSDGAIFATKQSPTYTIEIDSCENYSGDDNKLREVLLNPLADCIFFLMQSLVY